MILSCALRPANRAGQRQCSSLLLQEMAELFGEGSTDGELESEQLADFVFEDMQPSEGFSQVINQSALNLAGSVGVCGCC